MIERIGILQSLQSIQIPQIPTIKIKDKMVKAVTSLSSKKDTVEILCGMFMGTIIGWCVSLSFLRLKKRKGKKNHLSSVL